MLGFSSILFWGPGVRVGNVGVVGMLILVAHCWILLAPLAGVPSC